MDTTEKKEAEERPLVEPRIIRIKLIDGSRINGNVNLNRKDHYDRLSDLVTSNEETFLVLFDATVNEPDLEKTVKYQTLFINKQHVVWATPDEDQK